MNMRKILLLIALFAVCGLHGLHAQAVDKQTFVYAIKDADTLRLDRYNAPCVTETPKPCLMFMFGGGFVSGKRDAKSYIPFFEYYAQKGYTVVSIDYRLGLKKAMDAGALYDETSFMTAWIQTLAMATGDLYDATAYIVKNASEWGVDSAAIVASGSSAGAITVLMGEYGICNDHPMAQKMLPKGFNYAGVISFAGAIFDVQEQMRWAHNPAPMLLFHGDTDRNVPYDIVTYGGAGFFGSKHISEQLVARGVAHWFYSAAGTDHILSSRPMKDNREEIDAFLRKFVKERRQIVITTDEAQTGNRSQPATFGIMEYIETNFGL